MKILTISDLHCPYQHPDAFDFLSDLRKEIKPSVVVCLGDEVDFHTFSRFEKEPQASSSEDEIRQARKNLSVLYKLFPKVTVTAGNHTLRPYKKAQSMGLTTNFVIPIRHLLDAPDGWSWKESVVYDDVMYFHGDGFSGRNAAITAAEKFRKSVVIGHIHSHAGVTFASGPFDSIFGMNAGCLIDEKAYVFNYAKHFANRPVLGTGVVLDGEPHFIPMR